EDDEGFGLAVGPDGAAYATGLFFDTATFGDTTLVSAGGRDIFAVKYSPEGDVVWARNGGGHDKDEGCGTAGDAGGAAYGCGRFWDTATLGDSTLTSAGHYDVFLVKYSPEGDVLWADRGGSTGGERAYAVTVDGSDVYLVGRFARTATFGPLTLTSEGGQDVFLVKYTSDGHALWGRRGGGATDDVSRAVVVDAAGEVYVAGRFGQTATFGDTTLVSAGRHDVFLARYSPEGDLRWVRGGGGGGHDGGSGLALDAAGNAYVAGYFSGLASFGALALAGHGGLDALVVKYGTSAGSAPPLVTVAAAPVDPPVVVGPGGEAFDFTVTLTNLSGEPQTFQAWTAVTAPVVREPLFGPHTITLPAGATVTRTLRQWVPGRTPAGSYTYTVKAGTFPSAFSSASFPFEVVAGFAARAPGTGADGLGGGWDTSGWEAMEATGASAEAGLPGGFALSEPHPNPSASAARLTLDLAEAQAVTAEVLDALGRRVALLHAGPLGAGAHVLVGEGSSLPSGLCVVRVRGEAFTAARRLALVR